MRDRIATGIRLAAVVAAAIAGALVGLGARAGTPVRPFNSLAVPVLGARALTTWDAQPRVTLIAAVTLVVAALVLALLFSVVAGALRGLRLVIVALAFGLFASVTVAFVARAVDGGGSLSRGLLVVCAIVVAAALALGMGVARLPSRVD